MKKKSKRIAMVNILLNVNINFFYQLIVLNERILDTRSYSLNIELAYNENKICTNRMLKG